MFISELIQKLQQIQARQADAVVYFQIKDVASPDGYSDLTLEEFRGAEDAGGTFGLFRLTPPEK